ncbi:acetyltransferase (GNAT) family protein [Desulfosporosinus acididurans]|uniref:Acetyltransferase (GNAT) family protein n=1 Tax=Desulfosporosinus acididurans TaxID=476652 RepID=A0A0J1FNR7_9FIRM|nr:GNAT family N-acetyltransferase [Desulfosporosinus acididurans]KLU64608.1 acetyltransferase (GNAT) family protein [Desulfosporosinus acididurans]
MSLKVQCNCSNINWDNVAQTLKLVGMASYVPEIHKKAFENSHTAVFVFDDEKLVGFGRVISDGTYQAALYDLAILPAYQGRGIGRMIVSTIKDLLPNCNIILYAAPGKEGFYEKLDFRKMKTGMGLFCNAANMRNRGFIE